jgi:hypothetical protein
MKFSNSQDGGFNIDLRDPPLLNTLVDDKLATEDQVTFSLVENQIR